MTKFENPKNIHNNLVEIVTVETSPIILSNINNTAVDINDVLEIIPEISYDNFLKVFKKNFPKEEIPSFFEDFKNGEVPSQEMIDKIKEFEDNLGFAKAGPTDIYKLRILNGILETRSNNQLTNIRIQKKKKEEEKITERNKIVAHWEKVIEESNIIGSHNVEYDEKTFKAKIVTKIPDNFLGYPDAAVLFISDKVPEEFRDLMLVHKIHEMTTLAEQKNNRTCLEASVFEYSKLTEEHSYDLNFQERYIQFRFNQFKNLLEYKKSIKVDNHVISSFEHTVDFWKKKLDEIINTDEKITSRKKYYQELLSDSGFPTFKPLKDFLSGKEDEEYFLKKVRKTIPQFEFLRLENGQVEIQSPKEIQQINEIKIEKKKKEEKEQVETDHKEALELNDIFFKNPIAQNLFNFFKQEDLKPVYFKNYCKKIENGENLGQIEKEITEAFPSHQKRISQIFKIHTSNFHKKLLNLPDFANPKFETLVILAKKIGIQDLEDEKEHEFFLQTIENFYNSQKNFNKRHNSRIIDSMRKNIIKWYQIEAEKKKKETKKFENSHQEALEINTQLDFEREQEIFQNILSGNDLDAIKKLSFKEVFEIAQKLGFNNITEQKDFDDFLNKIQENSKKIARLEFKEKALIIINLVNDDIKEKELYLKQI